ncbi:pentraxin-4 [Misgurnus anguillicaudatus]|uniref:pentraxin-4 n=1 Tax=Misgurnus anguillicaudatus TaxID=75329 RepID=UPI003CCF6A13
MPNRHRSSCLNLCKENRAQVFSTMYRRTTISVFLVVFLQMHLTLAHRGEATDTAQKPLYKSLGRLNQQFKRFQKETLAHLQSMAENDKISHSVDARFRALSQQFKKISRELRTFKATTEQELNSLKSLAKNLQKSTKRLDSGLANMTQAVRENSLLNHRQIQKQKAVLSDLSREIHKQQSHIGILKNLIQDGLRDLQDSFKRHQKQITQLESQVQKIYQSNSTSKTIVLNLDPIISDRKQQDLVQRPVPSKLVKNRLPPYGPTKQPQTYKTRETLPTAQPEEDIFPLPHRHKIPNIKMPKEEAKICNVGSMLLFPSASTANYVTFQKSFPTGIHELSICTWLRVDANYVGTILSYATKNNDNTLVLYGRNSGILGVIDFVIGDPSYRELSVQNLLDGRWHHLCIIWSSIEGRFWYYSDRHLISTGSKFQKGFEIPPGGSLVLGQEQDSVGGGFDVAEAFVGRLAGFALWTRTLSPGEVSGLATGRGVPRGALLSLKDVHQRFGNVQHVTCECLEHCM